MDEQPTERAESETKRRSYVQPRLHVLSGKETEGKSVNQPFELTGLFGSFHSGAS